MVSMIPEIIILGVAIALTILASRPIFRLTGMIGEDIGKAIFRRRMRHCIPPIELDGGMPPPLKALPPETMPGATKRDAGAVDLFR